LNYEVALGGNLKERLIALLDDFIEKTSVDHKIIPIIIRYPGNRASQRCTLRMQRQKENTKCNKALEEVPNWGIHMNKSWPSKIPRKVIVLRA